MKSKQVYNPFDLLLLFSKGIYRPYWFETGTPTFLIRLWKENRDCRQNMMTL